LLNSLKAVIEELKSVLGSEWVVTDVRAFERYLYDETSPYIRPKPSYDVVLVKPGSAEEVSGVLKIARRHGVPVYVRGGGTGAVGGAVPLRPGIVMSLERFDTLIIDSKNMVAEAGAGVTLGRLIEEAEKHGLSFPPHPGDEGATVGGLIATNAGGSRAVRTGVIRNYVLGLEVVLPTGEILRLGAKSVKNNMGTNLLHFFIGSEGILGVITKAYLRLYPKWRSWLTALLPFKSRASAFRAARDIIFSGVIPLALEYFDRRCVEASAKHLGLTWPEREGDYYLMVIVAEPLEDIALLELDHIVGIARSHGGLEPLVAQRSDEQRTLLKIRSEIYTSLKQDTYEGLDTTVPIGEMENFIAKVEELEKKYGMWLPTYGHVGDGNIHVHILKHPGIPVEELEKIKEELYDEAVRLGGTITGEHGIGYIRRKYVEKYLGREWVEVMKRLKAALDPDNILNPDKVLP